LAAEDGERRGIAAGSKGLRKMEDSGR